MWNTTKLPEPVIPELLGCDTDQGCNLRFDLGNRNMALHRELPQLRLQQQLGAELPRVVFDERGDYWQRCPRVEIEGYWPRVLAYAV